MHTTKSRREVIVNRLRNREYRDEYVAALISVGLPSQIREMRLARRWSQAHLAKRAGMRQSQISGFERPGNESWALASLFKLASAFDVGLKVRFVPFSELVQEDAHPDRYNLNVDSFESDLRLTDESARFAMDDLGQAATFVSFQTLPSRVGVVLRLEAPEPTLLGAIHGH